MSKQALKAAKASLDARDWSGAESQCLKALSFEQSFFANLFLGLALFNLEKYDESEAAYKQAIAIEAEERQKKKDKKESKDPWQGLVNLYEKAKRVDEYIEAAKKLAIIFMDQDDRTKCQTVLDKVAPFVKEHGTKAQYKRALELVLPGSPLFEYMEGRIPHPSVTYMKLAEMIEAEEKERINKEIANRRSRLGAVLGQVKLEVKREVLTASPLEELYQNILNWSDDEEHRRNIESKLLEHGYEKLLVLPKEQKTEQKVKVQSWARGLVILEYPCELAWRIVIEWKDCESIGEHDVNILREFIELFPDLGLSLSLNAYLDSELSPFPVKEDDNAGEKDTTSPEKPLDDDIIAPDDKLDAMIDGLEKMPDSVMCHRILGDYYLLLEEYEHVIDVCNSGRKLVAAESQRTGLSLVKNHDAITTSLATAYIYYQTPKHHDKAKTLFEGVLKRNSSQVNALVGLGLVLEEQQDYLGANDLLKRALVNNPEDVKIIAEAAWCEVLQGRRAEGREELERCLRMITGVDPRSRDLKARILWRIGTAIWDMNVRARGDRNGAYSYFIQALQSNQNFAPAYTSLGIFYADIVNDNTRANKCFQKAFELSASEIEAAERLARSFAESREWELVEIVARRVAEADQIRAVPGKGVSWPQSAIGVVELNNQNFPLAIQAFQSALRSSPKDFHSWLGLGEAYASSGKYTAALKVFLQAQMLDNTNWFVKYMLANVRRELGEYDEACASYRAVLETRPKEFGVLVALSETLLTQAWAYVETGFYVRAAKCAKDALEVSQTILQERPDAFNMWKNVGDACLLFSWVQGCTNVFPQAMVFKMLQTDVQASEFDVMADTDGTDASIMENMKENIERRDQRTENRQVLIQDNEDTSDLEPLEEDDKIQALTACLTLGILAYKRAIYASAEDRHAHAVAWFNLGSAEYRTYVAHPRRDLKYRLAAIRCFKRTIKLEPGNHEFWNALGVAAGELKPKIAQHALVRALYINDKNARVWTNLGVLYFLMEDYELANETFSKAQSVDPEYALAWAGQGLCAGLLSTPEQALELFEHAYEISEQSHVPTKQFFATAMFDSFVETNTSSALVSILAPIFALEKLNTQLAESPTTLRLSALFDERVGNFVSAAGKLEAVCNAFEERYEESEAEQDLVRFAQSKSDLARMQLASQQYTEAIDNATMALDLSGDMEELKTCRLSAHLTSGLARYYNSDMDGSMEMFQAALTESDENPDVVCLIGRVLWAKGGENEREVAREQLFSTIETNPDHLQSIILLGTIGLLDQTPEVIEAVVDDLHSFRANDSLSSTTVKEIDDLLIAIAQLSLEKNEGLDAVVSSATTSVFLRPAQTAVWKKLADLTNSGFAAETALAVARNSRNIEAEELAKASASVSKIESDLRSIFVAPWSVDGWRALNNDVKACTVAG